MQSLLDEVKKWIERKEIIAIKGPRQSGKTTLMKMLSEWLEEKGIEKDHLIYITFEDREQLDSFSQNPKDFTSRLIKDSKKHYLLIDEAQYCPNLGQKLKLAYDLFENIKIIITGSSSLELKNQTGKFLVGRMIEFDLLPLNFQEYLNHADENLAKMREPWSQKIISLVKENKGFETKKDSEIFNEELLKHLNNYITFGGYPAVVTAKTKEEKTTILKNLINNYLDKDIVSFLQITDTIKFRKLATAISASNGGMIKFEELANQIGSYFKELSKLMDVLEQTYIIRRVSPYHKNLVTELKKAQKVYFVDTGLRNSLIDNFTDIEKRPDAGALAENFVLNELFEHAKTHFWRTTAKTEVDFITEGKTTTPIEVKFQRFTKTEVGKSLYGFLNEYAPNNCIIATKNFWAEKTYKNSKIRFTPITYI